LDRQRQEGHDMTPPAQSRFADTPMLVTGGASGIGRATVERAAAEGAAVAILDKNGDAASALAGALASAGHKVVAVVADVTDEEQVARAVEEATARLGAIRVLVNNAGGAKTETFEAADPASWRAELDLNLTGAWLVTRAVLPSLLGAGGAIVNVATVNALTAIAEPAYSAAKAGLLQLTKQLATEYGPRGIRTNAVVPGSIRTPIWDDRLRDRPDLLDTLRKWYPVGRVGVPGDVAAAILFLASADAGFINGASLVVDGGLTAGIGPMMREIRGS
jgi:NAD(P)-dependent dehydrogenase (short-subunit alcohol dehydrogenase family)